MPSPERLARFRLAPLRSARALTDPEHAMRRAIRVIGVACGARAVRCTVERAGLHVSRGDADALPAYTLPLRDGTVELGRVDVACTAAQWSAARPFVEQVAEALALLLAAHALPARALRGVWFGAQRIHDLNNAIGAVTLQLGVVHSLLQRGRGAEANVFAERCVREGDRIIELLARLRHG
jgi:hypothetical protein